MAKKKKKQKKNFLKKIVSVLIFIVAIAIVGYLGFKGYTEITSIAKDVENFEYTLPENIEDKIDLPTKIGDQITIEWKSSHPDIVSNLGVITQPDFESDVNQVTLTGVIKIEFKEILSQTILDLLGIEIDDLVYVCFDSLTYIAKISQFLPDRVILELVEKLDKNVELNVDITIAHGLVRREKMEEVIRRICELGAHEYIPVMMAR